jgi:proliferating cell nuclear antigen
MNIHISEKKKKDIFISLFHVLKNCSSSINATLTADIFHIQGIDKSHVCLFDLKINKKWFTVYEVENVNKSSINLSFDTNMFYSIISTKSDNHELIIKMNSSNTDTLFISFKPIETIKGEFKKSFKMTLNEYDYEELNIPTVDYDTEFTLSSKQVTDIFSQLNNFGNDIVIKCSEQEINFTTTGITGEMNVDIPVDDLSSYSIVEDEEIILTYSLAYVNKMCITNKLSSEINFSLSNDFPMRINYDLEDDSSIKFYIASKIID